MFRSLLLVIAALGATFAAGYYCHAPRPTARPNPVEPTIALPPCPTEPTPPPAASDAALDVIRAHFNTAAGLDEPTPNHLPQDPPPPIPEAPPPIPAAEVHSCALLLPFDVTKQGHSGIREAQLWMTHDLGKSWELLAKQNGAASPLAARLPEEGKYGLRLVLVGGDGATKGTPQPGAPPELLVIYDKQDRVEPHGYLLGVEVLEEAPAPRERNEFDGAEIELRDDAPSCVGLGNFMLTSSLSELPVTPEVLPMPRELE
jgi:hypothetical protein